MSILSEGFKFGNIVVNKKYTMTRAEMETIGDAEGYPDIFPIWCTDDNCLYILYKTTDGTANIANLNSIVPSQETVVLYPTVDPLTSQLSWEFRTATDQVPEPVVLQGAAGKSSYQTWLDLGNTGTEADFIASLKTDFTNLTDQEVSNVKTLLGIDTLEQAITDINSLLDEINS